MPPTSTPSRRPAWRRLARPCLALLALLPGLRAAEDDEHVRTRILPLLEQHCHDCHSHASGKSKGGLLLDSRAALLTGGDSGPAIVPGDAEASLLVKAIRYTDDDLQMPPKKKKLGDEHIALLTAWVAKGAPWPEATGPKAEGTTAHKRSGRPPGGRITDEDRAWWSFQPLADPQLPATRDPAWVATGVDAFIAQGLERAGLAPTPPATRAQLIRRLAFDLTGLPPSPEEVAAFVADEAPDAWPRLVDRLLDSPHYGEHWARAWLDLVRYADSDGYRIDDYRPTAWLYRDYVVDAFNRDKPYDRFVQEQLAGDELFPGDPDALVATGYLRHWIYEYNNRDAVGQWTSILNDVTDVTADVFLGVGLQCARCHDHKFDPFLQKDYFRLQAFFAPLLPRDDLPAATPAEVAEHASKQAAWEASAASVRERIAKLEAPYRRKAEKTATVKFPPETQALMAKPVAERTPYEHQIAELARRQVLYEWGRLLTYVSGPDKQALIALQQELTAFEKTRPTPLPLAFAATDVGPQAPPLTIPRRERLGEIEPGFLTILDPGPAEVPPPSATSTNRRSALARWITGPEQPLAVRVIVNRVWQQHFGQGLVPTASDLGRLGQPPSHPELLDWLARRFIEDGWSLKKLHRRILLSSTWRQSAFPVAAHAGLEKDPENRLLWRGATRRLPAEAIRDSVLAATGELSLSAGGAPVDGGKPRRSLFVKAMRNNRDPLLEVFDGADGFTSIAQRNTTTTPRQSLFMLNGDWALARAKAFAERLAREVPGNDVQARLARAVVLAYGRPPTSEELAAFSAFISSQRAQPASAEATPQVPFVADKLPFRDGRGAALAPGSGMDRLHAPTGAGMPEGDFTIEAYVLLRSLYETAEVRSIATRWDGDLRQPGWSFGITGKKSRYKPQTLLLQINKGGDQPDKEAEPLFSGLTVQVGRPYFVAVSVRVGTAGEDGITFYAKDLSNDDEPMLHASMAHRTTAPGAFLADLTIGGRGNNTGHLWDGVIDDVRLSRGALRAEQLLLSGESASEATAGWWRFETGSGPFSDSSPNQRHLVPRQTSRPTSQDPGLAAWVDLCHVLLNANEFIYVD